MYLNDALALAVATSLFPSSKYSAVPDALYGRTSTYLYGLSGDDRICSRMHANIHQLPQMMNMLPCTIDIQTKRRSYYNAGCARPIGSAGACPAADIPLRKSESSH